MSKKIYIDAGHGGKDVGAASGDFVESRINLAAALAARNYLAAYDCEVFLSRTADTPTRINDMTANEKKLGIDASVSIHHNSGGGNGCEVYYWSTDAKAKALAQNIIDQFAVLGQNSRGIKPSSTKSNNYGMCRINSQNGIPAILGEFAFVDNETDRQIINSAAKIKAEGEAYAKAIVKFLKLKLIPAVTFKPGDIVWFAGGYHYTTSNAANPTGSKRTPGNAKVTVVNLKGIHPYNLVPVPNGSNVNGWVNGDAVKANAK